MRRVCNDGADYHDQMAVREISALSPEHLRQDTACGSEIKNLWVDPVNEETVAVLDAYIPEWVAEHKQGWADASKVFSNGYRDTKFMNASAKEKSAVKRENDRLYAEVKRQKKAYERSEKVLTAWTDTKTRYQS